MTMCKILSRLVKSFFQNEQFLLSKLLLATENSIDLLPYLTRDEKKAFNILDPFQLFVKD